MRCLRAQNPLQCVSHNRTVGVPVRTKGANFWNRFVAVIMDRIPVHKWGPRKRRRTVRLKFLCSKKGPHFVPRT